MANFVAGLTLIPQISVLVDQTSTTTEQVLAVVQIAATFVPLERLAVAGAEAGAAIIRGADGAAAAEGVVVVQRWMSGAELAATKETGLLRGGQGGTHYVTDAANSSAVRAQQRLALPQTPEVRVTTSAPQGAFASASKVEPAFNMPGGGMERTATGSVPVQIMRIDW